MSHPRLTIECLEGTTVHVIVVGCGRVGSELSLALERSGHSVAVIDKNPRAFRRFLPDDWGGKSIVGYGFDRDHLEQAGITSAHALAAVTSGDNSNILTARIARETYQIPDVVARIYDPRRAVIYQRLGIPTVATVTWTTDQVMRRLIPDTTAIEWTDPTGGVTLVERGLPDHLAGRTLAPLVSGEDVRLVALTRGGKSRLATPDVVGQDGDLLLLAVASDAMDRIDERLGISVPATPGSVPA
jgi:trk system potassium uptake protein TrkA